MNPRNGSSRSSAALDWRRVVGGFGRMLIAVGLLLFGFVAYQLWGTGVETGRAQNRLEDQFQAAIADSVPRTTTAASPTAKAPTASVAPDAATDPISTGDRTAQAAPSVPTSSSRAAGESQRQEMPPIERGEVLAKLEIPKIGKEGGAALYVVPGVEVSDLKLGPGHYPDTPLPGQLGNSAIAGHRTTYGAPFRRIDELAPGDEIRITMRSGDVFVYEVTGTEIVEPSDYRVVSDSDPAVATLTLTSCHPVYSARQRIVVRSVLRPQRSSPVGEVTYYDSRARVDGQFSRGDSRRAPVEGPAATPPAAGQGSRSGDGSNAPRAGESSSGDAFGDGWFADSGAWPHIVGWGLLLTTIAFVIRRVRPRLLGLGVGGIPFLVCLFFVYQNINRLLPPGF